MGLPPRLAGDHAAVVRLVAGDPSPLGVVLGATVAVALACKEDVALSIVMLGLIVACLAPARRPAPAAPSADHPAATTGAGRTGWSPPAVGAAWYVFATRVIIPWRNHGSGPFYDSFFPALGNSIPQVVWNAVRHPSRVWHLARLPDRLEYYRQMFAAGRPASACWPYPPCSSAPPSSASTSPLRWCRGRPSRASTRIAAARRCVPRDRRGAGLAEPPSPRAAARPAGRRGAHRLQRGRDRPVGPFPARPAIPPGGMGRSQPPGALRCTTPSGWCPPTAGVSVTYYLTPHLTHRPVGLRVPQPLGRQVLRAHRRRPWRPGHRGLADPRPIQLHRPRPRIVRPA